MIKTIMVALEETISMPLVITEHGTIRIKGSRVSLESIVHHFKLGATAEQIVQSFPSLSLGEVYSNIAYYLTHRQDFEEYLQQQEMTLMLFKSNWSLILTPKPRSPNYALVCWAGGLRLKRTARERLWSRHDRAVSQIRNAFWRTLNQTPRVFSH